MSESHVDIWSDVSCPWCYIGKRSFDRGLERFDGRDGVRVTYHSFQLNPAAPDAYDGSAVDFLVQEKGMPADRARQAVAQVARSAAQVGLEYDVERVSPANTARAHQALHHAKARGLQLPLLDRLFKAYFAEGRAIGRDEVVADLAADVGLDHDDVLSVLRSGELEPAVRDDIERARGYGITGVPFYLVDGVYGLVGVQDPATFTALLERARAEKAESV